MPYIKPNDRECFDPHIGQLIRSLTYNRQWTAGELNYIISSIVWDLFKDKQKYQTANDIVGALTNVQLEFYRRMVAPYEDEKISENGDIIP